MRTSTPVRLALASAAAALVVSLAAPAHAGPSAFGLRGGLSDDPDQIFFGGHAAIHLDGAPKLRLEPSLELGVGEDSDFFAIRFNLNFKYLIVLGRRQAFYPIFGPAVHHVEFDGGGDDTEVGLHLGAGFTLSGINLDFVLGVSDIPDFTFTIGYTFW